MGSGMRRLCILPDRKLLPVIAELVVGAVVVLNREHSSSNTSALSVDSCSDQTAGNSVIDNNIRPLRCLCCDQTAGASVIHNNIRPGSVTFILRDGLNLISSPRLRVRGD